MSIRCQICNKEFIRITATHLNQHDMLVSDYKQRFGDNSILSEDNRRNMARTLKSTITKYGETEGKKRWEDYRAKQAMSNTFEYKKEKYGWSKEDFDEYNKSRSVTKDNMIKRWGEVCGTIRWEEYCINQAYVGVAKEYFIEKYGEVDGIKIYNGVCHKKGSSFRSKTLTDEHKLNCRLGTLRYLEKLHGQLSPRYNPKACVAIDKLAKKMGCNFQHAENGGEVRLDIGYWVDGYCESKNIVIEYFEPWHDKQTVRDDQRLYEIKEFLDCKIIVIREDKDGNQTIKNF